MEQIEVLRVKCYYLIRTRREERLEFEKQQNSKISSHALTALRADPLVNPSRTPAPQLGHDLDTGITEAGGDCKNVGAC